MKIIFLDIDGVLNSLPFLKKKAEEYKDGVWDSNNLDMIDPLAVNLLNQLVQDTGANIVVSSSWRIGYTVVYLQNILMASGLEHPERIIGTTSSQTHKDRGFEISLWLQQVSVDSFVVLDDDSDMTGVMDNLVQTSLDKGLTQQDIDKARKILNA